MTLFENAGKMAQTEQMKTLSLKNMKNVLFSKSKKHLFPKLPEYTIPARYYTNQL
jgi:hypothetical protein